MRLWIDGEGTLLTDEQVLRALAALGSLEGALSHGNIRLVEGEKGGDSSCGGPQGRPAPRRKLADYLSDEEG